MNAQEHPFTVGNILTSNLEFSHLWCEQFFRLSGNANKRLHSFQGEQIVQGSAILTRLDSELSRLLPENIDVCIRSVTFRKPIRMDEPFLLFLECTQQNESSTEIVATITSLNKETILVTAEFHLSKSEI